MQQHTFKNYTNYIQYYSQSYMEAARQPVVDYVLHLRKNCLNLMCSPEGARVPQTPHHYRKH